MTSDFVAQRAPRDTSVRARRPIHVRRCEPLINRIGARAKLPSWSSVYAQARVQLCPRERGARQHGLFKIGWATRTSSTPCATRTCLRAGSKISGATDSHALRGFRFSSVALYLSLAVCHNFKAR